MTNKKKKILKLRMLFNYSSIISVFKLSKSNNLFNTRKVNLLN